MSKADLVVLILLEGIGLLLIARLWRRASKLPLWKRCVWSILLLVPVIGWIFYGFLATEPEGHSDDLETRDSFGGSTPSGDE